MPSQQVIIVVVVALVLFYLAQKNDWLGAKRIPQAFNNFTHFKHATPMQPGDLIPASDIPGLGVGGYGSCGKMFVNGTAVPACKGSSTYSQSSCSAGGPCGCWV